MSTPQKDEFAARLARVQANTGRSLIMVGNDETFVREKKAFVQVSRRREVLGNLGYPAALIGSALLGMIAVAFGQYARFHLLSERAGPNDPDLEMLLAGGIGLGLALVLSQLFGLRSKEHRGMQGIGVFLMVCTFHNLPHWLPGPMALAFSPEWVSGVVANSPANSFYFRGIYYPLSEQRVAADPGANAPADVVTGAVVAPVEAAGAVPDCAGQKPAVQRIQLGKGAGTSPTAFKSVEAKTAGPADDCAAD